MAAGLRQVQRVSRGGQSPVFFDRAGPAKDQRHANPVTGSPRVAAESGEIEQPESWLRSSRGLFLGPKIYHKNVRHHRPKKLPKLLMIRMHQISVSILLGLKSQQETMCKAFVVLFGTDIRAPFERVHFLDL